jgi:lipid-A-disaccharide synthase
VRIAITSNGPGEFSGWVRPLVTALLRLAPETELTLFFVPDDYATGREPDLARRMFPRAHVVAPPDYVRFALGGRLLGAPDRADLVLYLGGDLLHAARVHGRLGGRARSYKFARKRWVKTFERVYAIDAKNRRELEGLGFEDERVELVGNLAVDGALGEAAGAFGPGTPGPAMAPGSILVMPGSRRHEIASGVPFFLHVAAFLRDRRPDLPVAFALSPFTSDAEIARALATGGHPNVWGVRGTVVPMGEGIGLLPEGATVPFPVVRDAMRHAPHARLVVTLPGTKCVELAALGVPTIVCVPLNAPEVIVINGPLQYLDRLPFAGTFLKRAMVVSADSRFPLTAQPNIDAGEMLMPELRGTLMPGGLATSVAAYADNDAERARASQRLAALYADQAGAAERMARSLLERSA